MRLSALAPLLARHAGSYLELATAAAAECRAGMARRLGLLLLGTVTALTGLLALWVTGLVALWDSPWRLAYAAATAVALLGAGCASLWNALSPGPTGPSTGALRGELKKDAELFRQWKETL